MVVAYLDFSKGFETVSISILLEKKLAAHGLYECTVHWEKTVSMAKPREWG